MSYKSFYHLTGDGAVIKEFILSEADERAAFNLTGVCAFHSGVTVVAFGHEDTHPHTLLHGTREACMEYKYLFESSYLHHAVRKRKAPVQLTLDLDLLDIKDENHLMNVGTYTVIQASKDGKRIMPYDYRRGTGSMYFRSHGHIPIWCFDTDGTFHQPVRADQIGARNLRAVCFSRMSIPGDWLICNGYILPDNYVDVAMFESIYRTANCFRTFMGSSRAQQQATKEQLAAARGVVYEDPEARNICGNRCALMFGFRDIRRLTGQQRIQLAQQLWRQYRLSRRQLALLVRLPYEEICKYT